MSMSGKRMTTEKSGVPTFANLQSSLHEIDINYRAAALVPGTEFYTRFMSTIERHNGHPTVVLGVMKNISMLLPNSGKTRAALCCLDVLGRLLEPLKHDLSPSIIDLATHITQISTPKGESVNTAVSIVAQAVLRLGAEYLVDKPGNDKIIIQKDSRNKIRILFRMGKMPIDILSGLRLNNARPGEAGKVVTVAYGVSLKDQAVKLPEAHKVLSRYSKVQKALEILTKMDLISKGGRTSPLIKTSINHTYKDSSLPPHEEKRLPLMWRQGMPGSF